MTTNKQSGFFTNISRDADELIGRTVLKATGKHFDECVEAGEVPPISLMLRAYWLSACYHSGREVGKAFRNSSQIASSKGNAQILDADDRVIGHTDIVVD